MQVRLKPVRVAAHSGSLLARLLAFLLAHSLLCHKASIAAAPCIALQAGPIYCSPVTARVLRHDFNLRPDCLRVLALDEPVTIAGVSGLLSCLREPDVRWWAKLTTRPGVPCVSQHSTHRNVLPYRSLVLWPCPALPTEPCRSTALHLAAG